MLLANLNISPPRLDRPSRQSNPVPKVLARKVSSMFCIDPGPVNRAFTLDQSDHL